MAWEWGNLLEKAALSESAPIIYVRDDLVKIELCISHDKLLVYELTVKQARRMALDLLIAAERREPK